MKTAVLLNDTSAENHVGSRQVVQNIEEYAIMNDIKVVAKFRRQELTPDNRVVQDLVARVDFIIINGEGTFHHSPKFVEGLLGMFRDKPSVLINTVWEKMFLVDRGLMRSVRMACVRESYSLEELAKVYDKKKISVVPDMVFGTNVVELSKDVKIGYGDSVMGHLRDGLSLKPNYFPLEMESTQPDLLVYLSWLKTLDVYVTGRYHGVCFATLMGIPFLAFASNSHKIEGMLNDMGCKDLLLRSFEDIPGKIELAKKAKAKMANYVKVAKDRINKMFEHIRAVMNDCSTSGG